jgi:hypothetical protein
VKHEITCTSSIRLLGDRTRPVTVVSVVTSARVPYLDIAQDIISVAHVEIEIAGCAIGIGGTYVGGLAFPVE